MKGQLANKLVSCAFINVLFVSHLLGVFSHLCLLPSNSYIFLKPVLVS